MGIYTGFPSNSDYSPGMTTLNHWPERWGRILPLIFQRLNTNFGTSHLKGSSGNSGNA